MSKEIECPDCGAVFIVDLIVEGEEADKPKFCPFCGNEDLDGDEDDDDDDGYDDSDDDDLYNDDED